MPADPLDFIDLAHATPEALMDALIHVTHQIKHYTAKKEQLNAALTTQLELGKVEATTTFDGFSFAFSAGRRTYDYPDNITALEADLQEAKAVAIAAGRAKERHGKPYWTVRELKS